MAKGIDPQFKRDVAALAAYEPRKRALALMAEGRVEEFLDWAWGDARLAAYGEDLERANLSHPAARRKALLDPLVLDAVLRVSRTKSMEFNDKERARRLAVREIELWGASPLEIALVKGSPEAFEQALSYWVDPKLRFATGETVQQPIWWTMIFRIYANYELCADLEPMDLEAGQTLLLLALMLGKTEQAEAMVRSGLSPRGGWEWDELAGVALRIAKEPDESFAAAVGLPRDGWAAAIEWVKVKSRLCDKLENAFDLPGGDLASEQQAKADALAQVSSLLDQAQCLA